MKADLGSIHGVNILFARTQFWFKSEAGGSVGHTIGILEALQENGFNLKIASNEAFLGIDDFNFTIIRPFKLKPDWLGELFYNFYAWVKLRKIITNFKPDIIYHRYTGYTNFVSKMAHKIHIPLILEFNSFDTWKIIYWEGSRNKLKKFIQQRILYKIVESIEQYNIKNADLIVVVSDALRIDLVNMGVPDNKILVNYNGVNIKKFRPEVSGSNECFEIKKRLITEGNELIIGFSGTFGPWHGIPELTEAIDIILKNKLLENVHFLIIGGGTRLKFDMENRLRKYKEVIFTGIVPYHKIQYYLGVCDILLSPHNLPVDGKEFFGSPTKIFEYMAMGKGIVASRLGQIAKVLENNVTAILVMPGNITELVDGILKLAKDKNFCKRIGMEAYKAAVKNYTWDRNVKNLIAKINSLKILK